uniref:Uncharacterized protein n=1 Tax=Setaria digitata TaxID=48799 RepID=A0A915Q4D9_9BILA
MNIKRWWSGNFKPWDGDFEPWNESTGGEDFIVFPGGRFGAWGDRIFIERRE